jgi:hypothetical protein
MPYLGTQFNNTVQNSGLYTPSEILQLTKEGSWGGSLELIEEQTISGNVAQVDFTDIKENIYDVHRLEIINARSDTDDKDFSLRVSVGGTFDVGANYHRALMSVGGDTGVEQSFATTSSQMDITLHTGNATNEKANSYIYIYNAGNSAKYTFNTNQSTTINVNNVYKMIFGGGLYDQTGIVDGFRIFMDGSGNIESGVFKLYGVKQI